MKVPVLLISLTAVLDLSCQNSNYNVIDIRDNREYFFDENTQCGTKRYEQPTGLTLTSETRRSPGFSRVSDYLRQISDSLPDHVSVETLSDRSVSPVIL